MRLSTPLKDAQAPAVFFANGIGDALMALPTLRALCTVFLERLTLITRSASYADILSRLPVKHFIALSSGARSAWENSESNGVAAAIGPCDLFISLAPWHSPSLAYLSEALHRGVTIGFHESFDIALPRVYTKHTAELMFDAVRIVDADLRLVDFLHAVPLCSQRARGTARAIRDTLRGGIKLVAVHTETTAAKSWPPAQWRDVLHKFLKARPEWIAILVKTIGSISGGAGGRRQHNGRSQEVFCVKRLNGE